MKRSNYFGRERICLQYINTDLKIKTLNIGAGEIRWLENDVFLGHRHFLSSDIDEKNLGNSNKALNKKKIDAENIPLSDHSFDQVILLDVLEHIERDDKALEEINRVLKIGGNFVLSVPNDTLLSYLNPIRYLQHKRHYSPGHIKRLLEKHGFKITNIFIGGGIFELIELYTHLIVKHLFRHLMNPSYFNKLRDSEYKKSHLSGNEIIILAKKRA